MSDAQPLLSVEDLRVSFATEEGIVQAVDGVSFDLQAGEVLAVVGSSAIRTDGLQDSASAIITRCRIPPENSNG